MLLGEIACVDKGFDDFPGARGLDMRFLGCFLEVLFCVVCRFM
jgi:hypothetical protein